VDGQKIDLSVVIPTFNRRDILALTLPTVLRQDYPEDAIEIVVVVDGSTDSTLEMLHGPAFRRVRAIAQKNRGPAAARNLGLKEACGRLILFLDDDMQCEPSLFRSHVMAHQACDRLIVEGAIELSEDSVNGLVAKWRYRWANGYFEEIRSKCDERWPWHAIRFANTSAPRDLLIEAGGFDERFRFAHEELEFGLRLARTSSEYRYAPEIVVRHVFRKSVHDVMGSDGPWYGSSHVLLSRLHPGYRKYSILAHLAGGSRSKRLVREVTARSPWSPNRPLGLAFRIVEKFSKNGTAHDLAERILVYMAQAETLRGAVKAAGSWPALVNEFGLRLPVLMYHHVGPRPAAGNRVLTVSPAAFAAQMRWLARNGYTPICMTDWINWCAEAKSLPEKPVLITFDDGYADVFNYAIPVLQRFGFPATIFIVTGLIGMSNEWDQQGGWPALPLMNLEQIREASRGGIEFGAHSRTHRDLTRLPAEQLRSEVEGSADDLIEALGTKPQAFAYPFGAYNDDVREVVRRVFRVAFTVSEGVNSLATDPHQMNRIGVLPGDYVPRFGWLLRVGYHPVEQLRDRLKLAANVRRIIRHPVRPSLPSS
jgi:peptidoglycan/xylan/chitin deacetylase (PgdA/CDA1 family)/glycosyltransferase involved in cell wall biosynthesis